jgi:hypothetical protein
MQIGPPSAVKSQTDPVAHGSVRLHGPPSSPPVDAPHAVSMTVTIQSAVFTRTSSQIPEAGFIPHADHLMHDGRSFA